MYLMWKDNNKPVIKVVSPKKKKQFHLKQTIRQFTKFFILQNEPEPKRYDFRSPSNGATISINFLSQPFPE